MPHIVVIDDRATNREVLSTLATTAGEQVKVDSFASPELALTACLNSPPDLIITDFNMPEMDGAEFIRRIRAAHELEDVPVIVVSAYEDRRYRYQALEAGATDFLRSPIDHFEFKTRARNLLVMRNQQLILKERAEHLEDRLFDETSKRRREMRESRRQLAAVIDKVSALIYAVDEDGGLVFINQYASQFFGGSEVDDSDAGLRLEAVSANAWNDVEEPDNQSDLAHAPHAIEERLVGVNGSVRTFLTHKTVIRDADTNARSVLVVSTDITERAEIENALRDAKHNAEIANEAKSQFLMNMSHELRTPLNVIIGFADFILGEPYGPLGDPQYAEQCQEIAKSGRHLLSLINEVLELSRLDRSDLELTEEPANAVDLVAAAINSVQRDVESVNLNVETDEPSRNAQLFCDPKKVQRILGNIISNAAKFSDSGNDVTVRTEIDDLNRFVFTVIDCGIGMSESDVEVARSRFGQVFEHARTKKYQGAGLGLPVAIGFAERHEATVAIESEVGKGTSVRITFPSSRTAPRDLRANRISAAS